MLALLAIPREDCSERIRIGYYEAWHMIYCHEPSRTALSRHLDELGGGVTPPRKRRPRRPTPRATPTAMRG